MYEKLRPARGRHSEMIYRPTLKIQSSRASVERNWQTYFNLFVYESAQ